MSQNLFQKVWDQHVIDRRSARLHQIFVDLHLIHEVTSPQAFSILKEKGLPVAFPERTLATVDHIIPTTSPTDLAQDPEATHMVNELFSNTKQFGIRTLRPGEGQQGIVHIVGPELGVTQPGMVIVCGDSHTSTHGAFGALAFGIGTSQVRDVLASQSLLLAPLKTRRIKVLNQLRPGVSAKDLALYLIQQLGVDAGIGYAHEYAGPAIEALSMDERMTLCNMTIEGGARCGYVNPDTTTLDYLQQRVSPPKDSSWQSLREYWLSWASDADATFDDEQIFDASEIKPRVTWGINPEQNSEFTDPLPQARDLAPHKRAAYADGLSYMQLKPGQTVQGMPIDVAFIGSCTNARLSDFQAVAQAVQGRKVHSRVKALAVPGSETVDREARALGIDKILQEAGFEWRRPGCSMCIAMNADKLVGDQVCASSSNRNFKGRQGSPQGRTLLMSPLAVAASAIAGEARNPQEVFTA
jgi:3-isopropylmalate/(R)-2-methylmalate dehydratase large subunit